MKSVNPTNGEILNTFNKVADDKIIDIINKTHNTFLSWSETDLDLRIKKFDNVIEILKKNTDKYAELMALEMGKPIKEGKAEIQKCIKLCEYYQKNLKDFLTPEKIDTETSSSEVHFRPSGVILAIMPWNYPFWQVLRFAVPNILAGNTCILKHASNVTGCAIEIQKLFEMAELPEGCFSSLVISSDKIESVISNDLVRAVTLTGSEKAGSIVAKQAGENLKKTVLELGGSDPYLILEDADIDEAARLCAESRLLNNGQSCISAKRFIVIESVYDQFLKDLKKHMSNKKTGDPLDPQTDLGPMARVDLRDELHEQVEKSIEHGAKLILGGKIPDMKGAFYPPTILSDVKKGMPAYSDELFGPVATVISAKDTDDAIKIANSSCYGLGGGVFTGDIENGKRIASHKIDTGSCVVNGYVKSDPKLPFGGVKKSGYGREMSKYGFCEFLNIKTVSIS